MTKKYPPFRGDGRDSGLGGLRTGRKTLQGGRGVRTSRKPLLDDLEAISIGIKKYFPESFFVFSKIIYTFAAINQIFFPVRVFGFIKKGGEIRLGETLATNPETVGERCQNLIPENREMIKINTELMNAIHLTHNNFTMPLMPMRMCR
jgi:hypothetical protein